jgi:hypothetical protein
MLSFRQYLIEYEVDRSSTTKNLPSFKGLQGPSISDSAWKHANTLWMHFEGIADPQFLKELKYKRGQFVKHPIDMSSDEVIKHFEASKKYVPERYHAEMQIALDALILSDPIANIELQNMGGVKGTSKERKSGPARNLQRLRRQRAKP